MNGVPPIRPCTPGTADRVARHRWPSASGYGVAAALLLWLTGLAGCSRDPLREIPAPGPAEQAWLQTSGAPGPWNVLLLTLDTTRRDRLGCYGYPHPLSPNLDRLAAEGILFEQAVAPAPITLPSHTTILTGLDPNTHGVRNNGTFALAESYTTLAEVLRQAGYATSATIGSFTLAAEFGLNQGFDVYDDLFPGRNRVGGDMTLQRTADQVTSAAVRHINDHVSANPAKPFFHWAHYFDPHFPYSPGAAYHGRFTSYDGEVAFMDEQVGQLLAELDRLGVREKTWILCVGDHGEALGEHGERTHGMLLYAAVMYVPCILVPPAGWQGLPASQTRGKRIAEVVGLRDLAPTLLNALGMPQAAMPASGTSLLPLVARDSDGPRVCSMESLMPFLDYGWSELRGVRTARWCYVRAPEPELYDLRKDPAEIRNLATSQPRVMERLEAWCEHFAVDAGKAQLPPPSPETIEKLRSLGYVASMGPEGPSVNDRDTKKLMPLFDKINDAHQAIDADRMSEAMRLLEEVLAEDPGNPEANRVYAAALCRVGEPKRAVDVYGQLLSRFPSNIELQLNLGRAFLQAGQADRAAEIFRAVHEQRPNDPAALNLYPQALAQQGRVEEARRFLAACPPDPARPGQVLAAQASFEWAQANFEKASRLARQALAADPTIASAHGQVGEWLWQEALRDAEAGRQAAAEAKTAEARRTLETALELDPNEAQAAYRLGWDRRRQGKTAEAEDLFRRALAQRPTMVEARVGLANLLNDANRVPEALQNYEVVRALGLEWPEMLVNYGVALAKSNRRDEAAAAWEQALRMNPDPAMAEGIRRNLSVLRGR